MTTGPRIALILCLSLALPITSCNNDDVEPIDPDAPIELGLYYLLESSVDKFPYNSDGKAIYVNEDGEETTFWIDRQTLWEPILDQHMITIWENGIAVDTAYYSYGGQSLVSELRSTKLGIKFRVSLSTTLWWGDILSGSIADVLGVSHSGYSLFSNMVDQRTWPESYEWNIEMDTVTFHGRTFSEAMTNVSQPIPGSLLPNVWFNFEEGIISFHDKDSTLWRFERFER